MFPHRSVVSTMVKQGSWDPEDNSASVFCSLLLWGRELSTEMGWEEDEASRCQITAGYGNLTLNSSVGGNLLGEIYQN